MNPSRSTLPSSSSVVATVVPWLTASMSAPVAPTSPSTLSMPARKPSAGLLGVDGVLVVTSSPESSSKATTSVTVPPWSMPIRIRRVMVSIQPGRVSADHGRPCRRSAPRPATSASASGLRRPVVVDARLLLAGDILDRGLDLVGDLPPGLAGRHAVVPPDDLDRLAEADGHGDHAREAGVHGLQPLGPGDAHGDDRDAGGEGEVRDAGATAVEATVAGAGALRVEPERVA